VQARRARRLLSRAAKIAVDASPLIQGTAAATAAWVIADQVVGHAEPFFAPIAAVIALNAPLGERGLNALRLLLGVVAGIAAGELCTFALGGGTETLALATFTAMAAARALGGARVTIAQAAVGAILTVAVADGQAGTERFVDALIGAGVALVFSQVLFSPEPVALLRRAEAAALAEMAGGLELTAQSLARDDAELGEEALNRLRGLRDRLAELGRTRQVSERVARRSAVWRSQRAPVVRERENAGHLDLLGGSCLLLTRMAAAARAERDRLAPPVRALARALDELAKEPGDRRTRQRAADHALEVARRLDDPGVEGGSLSAGATFGVRMVAADIMVFAGADPDQVEAAVRESAHQLAVPDPPPAPRLPFEARRWLPRRWPLSGGRDPTE
jgi:Fusaric acid resistance protein-like